MIFCSADASSDSCAAINDEGLTGKIGILHREDVGLREIFEEGCNRESRLAREMISEQIHFR